MWRIKTRSKYGNVKTQVDGFTFDSIAEAERYKELRLLLYAGEISDLKFHPVFPLEINGVYLGSYEADYSYIERGKPIVEDKKGAKTAVFSMKKKLLKALYGIDIRIT